MKKNRLLGLLCLILALCLILPMSAMADDERELLVSGTAVISVNPDRATINIGFYAEDPDLLKAQADTTAATERIIQGVTALGVESQDIVTSNFSIGPVYNYNSDRPTIAGYRVENMFTITVKDISKVAQVMNAALEAGANQSYGISFSTSKNGEVYREALKEAIKVAQLKAEAMADATGMKLTRLIEVKEVQQNYYAPMAYNVRLESAKDTAGMGDTIMSGALEITANVELSYRLGE